MKHVFFMSRHHAMRSQFDPETDCLISISDTEKEKSEALKTHRYLQDSMITLVFSDIPYNDVSSIQSHHVRDIVEFIENNRQKKNFYVHCLFGVSRSAAVAKYIQDYFFIDDASLDENDMYNPYVYDLLTNFNIISNS